MTAFRDALDLRAAVVEAVGDPSIAEVWSRLVSLAEARLNRELRTRQQINLAAVTLVGEEADLPADYLEARAVYQGRYKARGNYSFAGKMRGPNGPVTLEYYAKMPTLADSLAATNWLMETYPDLYLYAVATEAAKHLRDAEAAAAFAGLYRESLREAGADDFTARYAPTRIQIAGPTP